MDPRILTLRSCAATLAEAHGGDREILCLEQSARAALELIAELLDSHGARPPRGYKDACDDLVEAGLCDPNLCQRLKEVFDVAERARTAWSSLLPGDLEKARVEGSHALRDLADTAEAELVTPTSPASS